MTQAQRTVAMCRGQISDIFAGQLNGQCIATYNVSKQGSGADSIETWLLPSEEGAHPRLVMIVIYKNGDGWDYFVQGSEGRIKEIGNAIRNAKA